MITNQPEVIIISHVKCGSGPINVVRYGEGI